MTACPQARSFFQRTMATRIELFTDETVSDTLLREQVSGTGGVRLDLAAEVGHADTKIMDLFGVARSPDLAKELAMGKHFAGVSNQCGQQAVLVRRQVDLVS